MGKTRAVFSGDALENPIHLMVNTEVGRMFREDPEQAAEKYPAVAKFAQEMMKNDIAFVMAINPYGTPANYRRNTESAKNALLVVFEGTDPDHNSRMRELSNVHNDVLEVKPKLHSMMVCLWFSGKAVAQCDIPYTNRKPLKKLLEGFISEQKKANKETNSLASVA